MSATLFNINLGGRQESVFSIFTTTTTEEPEFVYSSVAMSHPLDFSSAGIAWGSCENADSDSGDVSDRV